ncbi:hypothetical protein OC835_007157, partial [Tilletia horrida]
MDRRRSHRLALVPSAPAPMQRQARQGNDILRFDTFTCQMLNKDGTPKQVYAIKTDGQRVECFVEAVEGESFSMRVDCLGTPWQHKSTMILGEEKMRSFTHLPHQWPRTHRHRRIAKDRGQQFIFSKVETTDDENGIRDPAEAARLGIAMIRILRAKGIKKLPKDKQRYKSSGMLEANPIAETAKKIGAVQFQVGPSIQVRKHGQASCNIDRRIPAIEFAFHCATRIGLELLGYVPKLITQDDNKTAPSSTAAIVGAAAGLSQREVQDSGAGPSKRRREDEDVDFDLEEARLREELKRLEQRREAARASQAQGSSSGSSAAVKNEPRAFDFSNGGTSR